MRVRTLAPLTLVGALLLPALAAAQPYGTLDAAASKLTFNYSQMGVSLDGAFPKFEATVRYDPSAPTAASTIVEVPVAAIDTGSEEGDDEVQGSEWFDTGTHPMARFESTAVKAIGPGQLEVAGTLSIKGNKRPITVPVTVIEKDGTATFDGSFTLNRTDFGVGAGMWAKDDVVAHAITVSFHLVTTPLAK